jgi:hypothetical protein
VSQSVKADRDFEQKVKDCPADKDWRVTCLLSSKRCPKQ